MYQGTTPAVIFTIKGYDLSNATVYVSFKKGSELLTKKSPAVGAAYDGVGDVSTIVCPLTQEETLSIRKGAVKVQIRFIYENGQAFATNTEVINMQSVIYPEVIFFGGGES